MLSTVADMITTNNLAESLSVQTTVAEKAKECYATTIAKIQALRTTLQQAQH